MFCLNGCLLIVEDASMRRVAAGLYDSDVHYDLSDYEDDSAESVQESSEGEQPREPSEEDTSLPGRRRRGKRGPSASRADKRIRTSSKGQPDEDVSPTNAACG